jgi:hypothetical protein
MVYYILLPGDTEQDCLQDTNILGEDSGFGTFWAERGLLALQKIISTRPELIELITILDERKKKYSVEQFVELISKKEVKFATL